MQVVERFFTAGSPDIVWRVLADVEHWCDWTSTVIKVEPLDNNRLKIGARYRVTQPKLLPAIYEVTKCVPNHRFTWAQKVPVGMMIADHRLKSQDGGTEVELSFATKGWLANIIGTIFSRMIRAYVATEANSLKRYCDTLAGAPSSSKAG